MRSKIESTLSIIEKKLLKNKTLRDNDMILCVSLWKEELPNAKSYIKLANSFDNFTNALIKGEITSPETICRLRRLSNQKNPSTRGKSYKYRKTKEEDIRHEIVKVRPTRKNP